MATGAPLEFSHVVGLGQTFPFQKTMLSTESTVNNLEPELDFMPQGPPDQSSGHSEDGSGSQQFVCQNCYEKFSKAYKLTKHAKVHEKPLQCHLCPDGAAAERKDLDRHFWVHHKAYAHANNIPNEEAACPTCGKVYTRSDNMKRHMKKHAEAQEEAQEDSVGT
jgi:uncharacterized Zn-finger protein